MRGIRGAICADANTREAIYAATQRLLAEILRRNDLAVDEIDAAFFTMTPDLNADFPAYAARDMGWTHVPMLGSQESLVAGAAERAIRVLVLARGDGPVRHVYLGRAATMRPDLTEPGDAEAWNVREGGGAHGEAVADAKAVDEGALGRLVVVGLGLVGGSVAAAARRSRLFTSVRGLDPDAAHADVALRRGLVDGIGSTVADEAVEADIVVLAAPVDALPGLIEQVGSVATPGMLVTDVGSTKRRVVAAMNALPEGTLAVAGHPMTGSTASGPGAANGHLFDGERWAVVPTERSDAGALERVERLIRAMGARPVRMEAETHDRVVARTSHLPAALAVALVGLASELRDSVPRDAFLAGPGLTGATRLAAGEPRMTAAMLADNADELEAALDQLGDVLDELRRTVREGVTPLARRLEAAATDRASLVGPSGADR